MIKASLTRNEIDTSALIQSVSHAANGAVSVFIGNVRSTNDGRDVDMIEYSAFEPMAEKEMEAILTEAADKFGVSDIVVVHRLGEVKIGEASVVIVAADPRRAPSLDALRYAIEELKRRVPIWKLEHYADGERSWVNAAEAQPA